MAGPAALTSIRYTDADKERAYWIWRTTGGRSYRRTAAIVGIERESLSRWANQDDWIARADREDDEDIGSIRHAVAAVITHELVPNIETAKAIRDNPDNSARDRLAAVVWLSGLAGVAPVSKVETAIRPMQRDPDQHDADITPLHTLTPDQLMLTESTYRRRKS